MRVKQVFKGITQKTKALLDSSENEKVDFKKELRGLKSEDLVAFANSIEGGTILVGVSEITHSNIQKGQVVGCDVSDSSKMVIMSKALACTPPISLSIFIENSSQDPIFRIEIPSSGQKPHCTNGGTYKVRKDGRNSVLTPDELLNIFLDNEAKKFNEKFKEATTQVIKGMDDLNDMISYVESTITSKMDDVSSSLGWTEFEATNTKDSVNSIERSTRKIISFHEGSSKRLEAILKHFDVDDPLKYDYMNHLLNRVIKEIENNKKFFERAESGDLIFEDNSDFELKEEEIKKIVNQAVKIIKEKRTK